MVETGFNNYRYPWRGGNRFELLVDGDRFLPAMLRAIDEAEHYILLELYLFESGALAERFIDVLLAASERGVALYLLLDDFGARGLVRHDRERLERAARLRYYNPLRYGELRRNLFRDHRKLLLVDGRIAFTGGAGITDAFDPALTPRHHWHEVMVSIEGPVVADWQALFAANWQQSSDEPLPLELPDPERQPSDEMGRLTTAQPSRLEIKRSTLTHIRSARERVWLATAYFVPSWKVRRALRRAARSGRDVRLLLPGPRTDHPAVRHAGRRFYARLLHAGVRIFEYQPRFLHAKVVLCDNWASVGSSNIDRWNLRWNLEANQEVESASFRDALAELFENDFAQSEEIVEAKWRRWHRQGRLREWFWGRIDSWLDRYSLGHWWRRR